MPIPRISFTLNSIAPRTRFEKYQTLDVVGDRHHGQCKVGLCPKVGPRLTDGPNTLATHLLHGAEYMLDARPHLGRFFEAPSSQKILLLFE